MTENEKQLNEFLKSCGYSVQLTDLAGYPELKLTAIVHMGVPMQVVLCSDQFFTVELSFGTLPKANFAAFFRRLLSLNSTMVNVKFSMMENESSLRLQSNRLIKGLDAAEFKTSLDLVGQYYWQYVPGLIQEFQLPPIPPS